MSPSVRTHARQLLMIWGAWTLFALFSATQSYLMRVYNSRVSFASVFRYAVLDTSLWACLTPLVLLLAGRMLVRRANWWRTLPVLLIAGILCGVVHIVVFIKFLPAIGYRVAPANIPSMTLAGFRVDFLTYWVLVGLRHGIEYYRQARTRELRASALEAKLALAQLEMLKMQLQPHFLFNTLHAISALMYRNLEGADRMIARLSDFLRLTLDSAGVQEVTLKREMECLDKYLEIEQVRFGERLQVRRSIEPDALDLMTPNLVLQPLVENAVRHGIAPRASGGRIDVSARRDGDRLIIEVQDDGPGPSGEIREGLGISNTRARLEQLYGAQCALELGPGPQGGFRARLVIPGRLGTIT